MFTGLEICITTLCYPMFYSHHCGVHYLFWQSYLWVFHYISTVRYFTTVTFI